MLRKTNTRAVRPRKRAVPKRRPARQVQVAKSKKRRTASKVVKRGRQATRSRTRPAATKRGRTAAAKKLAQKGRRVVASARTLAKSVSRSKVAAPRKPKQRVAASGANRAGAGKGVARSLETKLVLARVKKQVPTGPLASQSARPDHLPEHALGLARPASVAPRIAGAARWRCHRGGLAC